MRKRTVNLVAAVFFIISGCVDLFFLRGYSNIWDILYFLACGLLCVGLFIQKKALITAGCGAILLNAAISFILVILRSGDYDSGVYILSNGLYLLAFAMLLVSSLFMFKNRSSVFIMVLTIVFAAAHMAVTLSTIGGYIFSAWTIKYVLFIVGQCVGCIIASIYFFRYSLNTEREANVNIYQESVVRDNSAPVSSAGSYPTTGAPAAPMNPQDIIQLKELLDMGIITQEEFDAKKKQLLGL